MDLRVIVGMVIDGVPTWKITEAIASAVSGLGAREIQTMVVDGDAIATLEERTKERDEAMRRVTELEAVLARHLVQ